MKIISAKDRRGISAASTRGFTFLELMISLAIGIFVLGGLLSFFINSSNAYTELKKTAEHTSNGSLGMWMLTQDINHGGYYGEFYTLAPAAALPDPCLKTTAALLSALAFPIQGYDAPGVSPLTCLSNANYVPGTDILVVRNSEFVPLAAADIPVTGEVYMQANVNNAEIQIGAGNIAVGTTKKADRVARHNLQEGRCHRRRYQETLSPYLFRRSL